MWEWSRTSGNKFNVNERVGIGGMLNTMYSINDNNCNSQLTTVGAE